MKPDGPMLQSGDCLLYRPGRGVFGWLISIKTWHRISHVEIYWGGGASVASRDGKGVGTYPTRFDGLGYVLRPARGSSATAPLDMVSLSSFARACEGQAYDWLGLLRFGWRAPVSRIQSENKQFCSEFATRCYRKGGLDPFPRADADAIAPCQFLYSIAFDLVWADDGSHASGEV